MVQRPVKLGQGSLVNAGFRKEVRLDRTLHPGTRVTVKINDWENSASAKCNAHGGFIIFLIRFSTCLS